MKNIVTLLILFIGFVSMAQSNLTVFNNSGQQFYVILNGIKQNSVPQTNVYIGGIRNGSYALKLIFADGKTKDIDKMFFIDTPSDITTRVVFKKGKGKLQWLGEVPTTGTLQQQGVITYRPDNSAVYSDAPVTTTQQVVTQTTTTSTPITTNQSGTTNGNGAINSGTTTAPSGTTNGNVSINSGMNGGINQSATTGGNVTINSDMNGGTTQSGTQGGNVSINSNTTGTSQTTTVTDPTNLNGNFGMNININVTDPTMNNGVGGMNIGMNASEMGTQTTQTATQSGSINVSSTTTNSGMGTQTTTTTAPGGNVNVNMTGLGSQATIPGGNVNVNTTTTNTSYGTQTTNPEGNVNLTLNGVQSSSSTTITQTTTTTTSSGGTSSTNNGNITSGNSQINSGMNSNSGSTINTNTVNTSSTSITCTKVLGDEATYVADLKTITFDEDRIETIMKDMVNKCLNASQAYKILETLTFENDRLEMAMYLYDRLLDKDKGSTLLPLFTFDSSKMEFRDYMRK